MVKQILVSEIHIAKSKNQYLLSQNLLQVHLNNK